MRKIELRGRTAAGLVALVDDEDFELVAGFRWYALRVRGSLTTYARSIKDNQTTYMHRLILNPPDGLVVDHIDRNGLNNQRGNLRAITLSQNTIPVPAPVDALNVMTIRRTTSAGRSLIYYYHRPTGTRLPNDPLGSDFQSILLRLNEEHNCKTGGKQ